MKRRHGINTSSSKRATSQPQPAQIERQSTQVSQADSENIQIVQEVSATTVQVMLTKNKIFITKFYSIFYDFDLYFLGDTNSSDKSTNRGANSADFVGASIPNGGDR